MSEYWLPKINENADTNIELLIVGNKTDLINHREVTKEEVTEMISLNPNLLKNRP
jgi:GTPase SAR1 family protein